MDNHREPGQSRVERGRSDAVVEREAGDVNLLLAVLPQQLL